MTRELVKLIGWYQDGLISKKELDKMYERIKNEEIKRPVHVGI